MWQHPIVRLLLLILGAWMGLEFLNKLFGLLVMVLVVLCAGLVSTTLYLLRYDRRRLAKAYRYPPLRLGIDALCRLLKEQPPVDIELPASQEKAFSLKEPEDFDWAARKLKDRVFGQDSAVDAIVSHLKRSVLLRNRSQGSSARVPLGIFLLAGPDGIGKRHLATQLGQLLYQKGSMTILNMAEYGDPHSGAAALFGGPGQDGHLLRPVKARPYHVVVLENVDAACPRALARLEALFQSGCASDSGGSTVGFAHCVFFLLTTRTLAGWSEDNNECPPTERLHRLAQALAGETGLSRSLLALTHEMVLLKPPAELDKARVILRMMQEECLGYRVTLTYVEPEIVADEVARYDPAFGFAASRSRIANRLRAPLAMASQHHLEQLVLTRELYLGEAEAACALAPCSSPDQPYSPHAWRPTR